MSDDVYDDVRRERVEMMVDIYESVDGVRAQEFRTANTQQPPQNSGSDSVKMRSSTAALVCLMLLCFLLLTAVIVLCVFIYTNDTNYTQERNQLPTSITNITEERDEQMINYGNMLSKTDQIENLLPIIDNCTNYMQERNKLLKRISNLTEEGDKLLNKNIKLTKLWKSLTETDGWIYQSSFYYVSAEMKSWTESREYCTERGADLVVINNRENQDFVKRISADSGVWIGLTDSEEEGRWKWVDGRALTPGFSFWGIQEPNGQRDENCAVSFPSGWYDYQCNNAFKWICKTKVEII